MQHSLSSLARALHAGICSPNTPSCRTLCAAFCIRYHRLGCQLPWQTQVPPIAWSLGATQHPSAITNPGLEIHNQRWESGLHKGMRSVPSICGTAVFLSPRGWRAVLSRDGLGCAAALCSTSFHQMLRRAWWGPNPSSDLHAPPADPAPPSPPSLLLALPLLADATQALVRFHRAPFWRGSLARPCLGSPGRILIGRAREMERAGLSAPQVTALSVLPPPCLALHQSAAQQPGL